MKSSSGTRPSAGRAKAAVAEVELDVSPVDTPDVFSPEDEDDLAELELKEIFEAAD